MGILFSELLLTLLLYGFLGRGQCGVPQPPPLFTSSIPATPIPCYLGLDAEPRPLWHPKGRGCEISRDHPFGLASIIHDGRDGGENSPNMFKGGGWA